MWVKMIVHERMHMAPRTKRGQETKNTPQIARSRCLGSHPQESRCKSDPLIVGRSIGEHPAVDATVTTPAGTNRPSTYPCYCGTYHNTQVSLNCGRPLIPIHKIHIYIHIQRFNMNLLERAEEVSQQRDRHIALPNKGLAIDPRKPCLRSAKHHLNFPK